MKTTEVVVSKKMVAAFAGELLVAFVAHDEDGALTGDGLLGPLLQSVQEFKEFSAKKDQKILLYPAIAPTKELLRCKRLLLLGLGNIAERSDPNEIFEEIVGREIIDESDKAKDMRELARSRNIESRKNLKKSIPKDSSDQ